MEVTAGIGLVSWGIFALLKVHPKAQYVALALAGFGLAGGILGGWHTQAGSWMATASSTGTGSLIGVSMAWALALGIVMWWGLVMWPNRIEPAGTATSKSAPPWGDWIHVTTLICSPFVVASLLVVWAAVSAWVGTWGLEG